MKTFKTLIAFIALGLSLVACNKPAEQAASVFDIEKVKPVINELHQKLSDAASKTDSVAFASLYHAEGMLLPPNFETVTGPEKIASFVNGFFKMGMTGLTLNSSEVWGNQDVVVVTGTFEVMGKTGTLDKGKYIELWKDENGQWKLFRDIWNTSMPMPAPAAAGNKK